MVRDEQRRFASHKRMEMIDLDAIAEADLPVPLASDLYISLGWIQHENTRDQLDECEVE